MNFMPSPDFIIRGRNVVLPDAVAPASVHIRNGVINEVGAYDEISTGCEVIDAGANSIVMPGLVDSHVHINEPGRTDWEGFETATRAAAAGGVTTVCDMPLNSIPVTTTAAALAVKRDAAADKTWVDYALWGGLVPGNARDLDELLDAGVPGFKCF